MKRKQWLAALLAAGLVAAQCVLPAGEPGSALTAQASAFTSWSISQESSRALAAGLTQTDYSYTIEGVTSRYTTLTLSADSPVTVRPAMPWDGVSIGFDTVRDMANSGIMNGKENNRFDPTGNATRAEVATILMNYTQEETVAPEPVPDPEPTPDPEYEVDIRCGGQLADHHEATVMVSPQQLERIPGMIRQVLASSAMAYKANGPLQSRPVVYLSTDSSKAEAKLRSELTEMTVLTVSSLQRGHTVFAGATSLQRALLDIYLICKSHTFLATQGSGFSQIARMLCMPEYVAIIPVNKTHIAFCVCNKQFIGFDVCWLLASYE